MCAKSDMENKTIDRYQIPYTNLVISKFAERYSMTPDTAFAYLLKYGGMILFHATGMDKLNIM